MNLPHWLEANSAAIPDDGEEVALQRASDQMDPANCSCPNGALVPSSIWLFRLIQGTGYVPTKSLQFSNPRDRPESSQARSVCWCPGQMAIYGSDRSGSQAMDP
jgi:hypothetical protein